MQKVVRIGNSKGLTIPKKYADYLGMDEGTLVDMQLMEDRLVIKVARRKYTMAELLAKLPDDFVDDSPTIDWGPDVGEEIVQYEEDEGKQNVSKG